MKAHDREQEIERILGPTKTPVPWPEDRTPMPTVSRSVQLLNYIERLERDNERARINCCASQSEFYGPAIYYAKKELSEALFEEYEDQQ